MMRVSGRQTAADFSLRVLTPLKSEAFQRNCSSVHSCVYTQQDQFNPTIIIIIIIIPVLFNIRKLSKIQPLLQCRIEIMSMNIKKI